MWMHFESFHITMKPTYMSMYFPAQGLVLAAGKVLAGHPWFGLLMVTALMCAAICWMLQAWVPLTWALLGGILAVLRLGLFSYWIGTYAGAGSVAALGGALVLGALPRFMKEVRFRDGLLLAAGVILLGTCRLYEGMLLCLPVAFALMRWIFFGKSRPATAMLIRRTAVPLALIVAAGAWMGYYNYRVFRSSTALPYTVNHAQYGIAPFFLWQSPLAEPAYRHKEMRDFYTGDEFKIFKELHPLSGFVLQTFVKAARGILFYAGVALLLPLIMVRRVMMDRRHRLLILCVLVLMAGQFVETFFFPHYLAPFTGAFYALGLQAMRHLRQWNPGNQPVGMALVRLTVILCVSLAGLRLFAEPLHLDLSSSYANEWYGRRCDSGAGRAKIAAYLAKQPDKALVIVRYSPNHSSLDEWVYNSADIDNSKVVWAREMDEAENLELIRYYKDRTVWLVQPDTRPASVSLYASPAHQTINASR
jgi:hypothetical protein